MRLIIAGEGNNGAVEIVGNRFVIGRDPDSDLTLDDSKVSRHHAALKVLEDGRVELEDLDSANGTFVNGSRVDAATLEGGEELQVGRTKLAVERDPTTIVDTEETPVPEAREAQAPFILRLGNREEIEARGERFTIGRDPGSDLTLDDPKVSREHAYLNVRPDGRAELHDRSVNGSFVDGRRIDGTELLQGGEQLRFGETTIATSRGGSRDRPPATQVDLSSPPPRPPGLSSLPPPVLPPPLPPRPPERDSAIIRIQRSLRRTMVLSAVAIVAAVGIGVAFALGVFGGGVSDKRIAVTKLERATVLISFSDDQGTTIGSGTIISPDGMIVTNAHVGDPTAPGLGLAYGPDSVAAKAPDKLTVALFQAEDRPTKPMYTAKVLASDGYLDVAVLKIDGTADGGSIDNSTLQLPTVPVGSSGALESGDDVTIVGYPGVGGGFEGRVNVSKGTISGFQGDDRITKVSRGWLKTDAQIAHGNSGGLAADDKGRLIGIPSRIQCGATLSGVDCDPLALPDTQGKIRPIDLVKPVIAAAKNGDTWTSPYFVVGTGNESFTLKDWATGVPTADCTYESAPNGFTADSTALTAVFDTSGMTPGEDLRYRWYYISDPTDPNATPELVADDPGTWKRDWGSKSSCFSIQTPSDVTFKSGTYELEVLAGPNLQPVADPFKTTVG